MEPGLFEEYEFERVDGCYKLMQRIKSFWAVVMTLIGFVSVASGNNSLPNQLINLIPILTTFSGLKIFERLQRESARRDHFTFGIAAQLLAFIPALAIRSLIATPDHTFLQYRNYFLFFMSAAYFQTVLGYLPDRIFNCLVCPSMFMSWIVFHIKIDQLNAASLMLGIVIACTMAPLRGMQNTTNKQNFLMARELMSVRSSLEEVMSAQQSVLSTFFDASCVCDDRGNITEATPQPKQLMVCDEDSLIGKPFASLAPPEERKRIGVFLNTTWNSGVAAAAMIETRFMRAPPGARQAAAPPTAGKFEARVHCIRLPGARVATESMKLWAHGGMFLGLQETGAGGQASGTEVAGRDGGTAATAERCRTCLRVQEEHEIVFDAGSTSLQVVGCSPLFSFAGLGHVSCGLHDMVPPDVVQWLDEFVVSEVQSETLGESSRKVLQGLSLKLPPSPGVRLSVRSAELKLIKDMEDVDAEIPVVLRLSGLKLASARRGAASRRRRRIAGMDAIWEGESGSAREHSDSDTGEGETADEASTMWPDDSVSQQPLDDIMSLQSGAGSLRRRA